MTTTPASIAQPGRNAPIGIFDSGVGGLSIWREVSSLLPSESIIYFADSANCPYGQREQTEVQAFSERIVRFLLEKKCKLIVVACNTATAMAIDHLRRNYPVSFVGIEPGVKPAALESRTGVIGILATAGTLKGRIFNETKARFASHVKIQMTEGTGLVEIVEQGKIGTPEAEILLRRYIEPMLAANIDKLVLGCTHYSFLADDIRKITQGRVALVEPNLAVAQRTKSLLNERELLRDGTPESQRYEFYSSGPIDSLSEMVRRIGAIGTVEMLQV
ncbi:MAG: glutamate racemase [Puniceicoccales bacterium]|jgi:glutamate racemase|nr:glutamate racemase [Puniceicoccales bacterium]